jgi:hypothetical protein
MHHANLSALASQPGATVAVGGLRLSAAQHRLAAELAGEVRTAGNRTAISFRALFLKGVLELSFLQTYRDAGKVRVRLTRPSEDSLGGFKLACLGNLRGPSKV